LLENPEGYRPLGRHGHRWDCEEIGWEVVDFIFMTQDRYQLQSDVKTNGISVPKYAGKLLTTLWAVIFSRTALFHGVLSNFSCFQNLNTLEQQ
jgi:hypothetical protein